MRPDSPASVLPPSLPGRCDPADAVHWPTLRSKLLPLTVIRLPGWQWAPKVYHHNWYHGAFWQIAFGCWLILGGACEIKGDPNPPLPIRAGDDGR